MPTLCCVCTGRTTGAGLVHPHHNSADPSLVGGATMRPAVRAPADHPHPLFQDRQNDQLYMESSCVFDKAVTLDDLNNLK